MAISFTKIILNSIWPRIEILGNIPGADIYCSKRQYPIAVDIPGLLIIRIDSSMLCFVNSSFIRERSNFFFLVPSFRLFNLFIKIIFFLSFLPFSRVMRWVDEKLEASVEESEFKLKAVVIDMSSNLLISNQIFFFIQNTIAVNCWPKQMILFRCDEHRYIWNRSIGSNPQESGFGRFTGDWLFYFTDK